MLGLVAAAELQEQQLTRLLPFLLLLLLLQAMALALAQVLLPCRVSSPPQFLLRSSKLEEAAGQDSRTNNSLRLGGKHGQPP